MLHLRFLNKLLLLYQVLFSIVFLWVMLLKKKKDYNFGGSKVFF